MSQTQHETAKTEMAARTAAVGAPGRRVSAMAEGLTGSEILKIAADVRGMLAEGHRVCNLTVGDFSPAEFRIPAGLESRIVDALREGETNYPPSDGMPALRKAVQALYARWMGLRVPLESVLVTAGSRPGIYTTYRALVDPGDRVVYPVPSWNNDHYCRMVGAEAVPVPTRAEDAFLPTRALLEDAVRGAVLLALNSPLNPTGTAFTAEQLGDICDLVLEENARRGPGDRPLYVMYDQVYGMLTLGGTRHVDPVSLRPEMERYTIFVDGASKAFAATGVRVGWVVAPADLTTRMGTLLGHVGAWAPRAEQVALAAFLDHPDEVDAYQAGLLDGIQQRLDALFHGLQEMRAAGHPVDAISPMGAIYLTARFDLFGRRTPAGQVLRTNGDIRAYLLESAGLAVIPFQAFGLDEESGWFRLSVGAVSPREIAEVLPRVREAVEALGSA